MHRAANADRRVAEPKRFQHVGYDADPGWAPCVGSLDRVAMRFREPLGSGGFVVDGIHSPTHWPFLRGICGGDGVWMGRSALLAIRCGTNRAGGVGKENYRGRRARCFGVGLERAG